jgi:tetratricopeptide (TPR) repeat protein
MRQKIGLILISCFAAGMVFEMTARACIWDADTLLHERLRSRDLASVILGDPAKPPDPGPLRKRISDLEARRREEDPSWWNDLAGAHLRLGEARMAAELLETVTNRFKDDYGIHANLGTAYHLLGRYQEAEREIARDLEINPDAHFGLEKYHLALLQYLVCDADFQRTHVYVDEWSMPFLSGGYSLPFSNTRLSILT